MADKQRIIMLESEIPAFVDEVIKTGCDICAIGHEYYTIGDADLPKEKVEEVTVELDRIWGKYGDRDHLRFEIVAHLRSLGAERPTAISLPRLYWWAGLEAREYLT